MQVFISWSGERSGHVARWLRNWLKVVLRVKTWMSEHDIASGERWSAEIQDALAKSTVAIICVTRENATKPWLQFEAGAAANVPKATVTPLLIDVEEHELLRNPITQFQMRPADAKGIKTLVEDLNKRMGEHGLSESELEEVLSKFLPDIDAMLKNMPNVSLQKPDEPKEMDLLKEVLATVRRLDGVVSSEPRVVWAVPSASRNRGLLARWGLDTGRDDSFFHGGYRSAAVDGLDLPNQDIVSVKSLLIYEDRAWSIDEMVNVTKVARGDIETIVGALVGDGVARTVMKDGELRWKGTRWDHSG